MPSTHTGTTAMTETAGNPLPAARAGLRAAVRELLAVAREVDRELTTPVFTYREAARLVARLEEAAGRVRLAANSLYYAEENPSRRR
ncbi:hypothetical protein [Desulfovirgula thermocuniculi]|uniref:hypothetical protein n=1 Tax=Desulfovirgula thermocuniculi TaxID=348842 RepID=UPI0012EC77A4|nr:hypothetical protein [Desulfovirgula thermocuniculi]